MLHLLRSKEVRRDVLRADSQHLQTHHHNFCLVLILEMAGHRIDIQLKCA